MSNEQSFIRNVNLLVSKIETIEELASKKQEIKDIHTNLDELLGAISKYESLKNEAQRFNENKESLTTQIVEAKQSLLNDIQSIKEPLIAEIDTKLGSLKDRLRIFAVDLETKAEEFETRNNELISLYRSVVDELNTINTKVRKVEEFKAYFDSTKVDLESKNQTYKKALELEPQINHIVNNYERIDNLVNEFNKIEDVQSVLNQAKRLDKKDEFRYRALDLKVDLNYAKSIALFKSLKGE